MSAFAAWGLAILGLAVISTVAEILLPQGKTRKVIRSVFASVAVLVIVTPIPSLVKNGFRFDFDAEVQPDTAYLEYIEESKKNMLAEAAYKYLEANGYSCDGIKIEVELSGDYGVNSAVVEFSRNGINGNGEHINKSEIIGLIADYFGIGKEAIMSYG
ncbi:MAG: stage III sporulation protein AF [Roseburia sp.]|nr:stage III sporulation protein AF [Roseburia sp.]